MKYLAPLLLLFVTGCHFFRATTPTGGRGDVVVGDRGNGQADVKVGMVAPGNPNTPTTSTVRHSKVWQLSPAIPKFDGTLERFTSMEVPRQMVESTEVVTTVGAAHKDNSNEIIAVGKANAEAYARVQYFGIACVLFAALNLWTPFRVVVGGGKGLMVASAAAGAFLLLAPSVIQGHETLVICLLAAAGAGYWFVSRSSYHEGHKDASTSPTSTTP